MYFIGAMFNITINKKAMLLLRYFMDKGTAAGKISQLSGGTGVIGASM
jgi:hypothetical protein